MSSKLKVLFNRRKFRVRNKIKKASAGKLRLVVEKSNQHLSVQLIDDAKAVTLVSASTKEQGLKSKLSSGKNIKAAEEVGALIAQRASEKGINSEIVFDRGAYLYHGKIKALADAARKAGLKF